MPGQGYPSERVATTKYEQGGVETENAPKDVSGSDNYKPSRPGQDADDK